MKNSTRWIVLIGVVVSLVLVLGSGLYTAFTVRENIRLHEEKADLQQQITDLEVAYELLTAEKNTLQTDLDNCVIERTKLETQLGALGAIDKQILSLRNKLEPAMAFIEPILKAFGQDAWQDTQEFWEAVKQYADSRGQ